MPASCVGLPDLPGAVLKNILEQVSLLDKLACEQVCKSWMQAMQNPETWIALYGARLLVVFSDITEEPEFRRDSRGISDTLLQLKPPVLQVAVPSLHSMPSPPSNFSLWLARRWSALTHVSFTEFSSSTGSPLENIFATCTSAISGSISGPEIKLCLGVYHLVHSIVSFAAV